MNAQPVPVRQPGQPRPPSLAGPPGVSGGLSCKLDDIGYFDPERTSKTESEEGGLIQIGRDLYFLDMLLFTEKIKDMAMSRGADII